MNSERGKWLNERHEKETVKGNNGEKKSSLHF